jgi:eukaryotic-like serine/threonine-protein kinase
VSAPQDLIAGRYRLVHQVGTGGMGAVWEAWDERLQRRVAAKLVQLPPGLSSDEAAIANKRAMREARISARLHHRHAVPVFDVVDDDGQPCLIMQFLPSLTLAQVLREVGSLQPHEAAKVGSQVASALAAAHELGIVHRDVKPGNILIADDGSALISDFGISHALGDITLTTNGLVHGTPAYLAPEAARGEESNFASDVFSLGSTLYAAMEGSPPFGTDQNSIALLHRVAAGTYKPPQQSGPLTPLLLQMLSTEPSARPSMPVVATSLARLTSSETAGQAPLPLVPTKAPPAPTTTAAAGTAATTTAAPTTAAPTTAAPTTAAPTTAAPTTAAPTTAAAGTAAPTTAAPTTAAAGTAAPTTAAPTTAAPTTAAAGTLSESAATTAERPAAKPAGSPPMPSSDVPPAQPSEPRRRTARWAIAVGALFVVGAVIALLASTLPRTGSGTIGQPRAASTATSAQPTPFDSKQATSSASSDATLKASPVPSPTQHSSATRTSAAPRPTSAPPKRTRSPGTGSPTAAQLISAITSYYALMPKNTTKAWPRMTASYQTNHAGGRQAYEAFWNAIRRVTVRNVSASPPSRAQATLVYYFKDGRVVTEVTAYELVRDGGTLKINDSTVLSSSTR